MKEKCTLCGHQPPPNKCTLCGHQPPPNRWWLRPICWIINHNLMGHGGHYGWECQRCGQEGL